MMVRLVIIGIWLLKLGSEGQQRHFYLEIALISHRIKHYFTDLLFIIRNLSRNFSSVPLREAVLKERFKVHVSGIRRIFVIVG